MNLEDCFEKRLLRSARPDRLKSKKALEMAERAIMKAEKLMEHGFYGLENIEVKKDDAHNAITSAKEFLEASNKLTAE